MKLCGLLSTQTPATVDDYLAPKDIEVILKKNQNHPGLIVNE